ncbi:hypothetical protein ACP6JC_000622 [Aspergillus fumigatus]
MPSETSPASVKEIWEKTIVRFYERTGQKLDGVSKGPEDLRRLLDAHYAAQADDKNVSQAKAVGFQMIHCIQLLGGIASQGASMVFAPAGLCFNALSFLLDIPKKVHEFHGEIDAIFAEVGPALAQFRMYERMEETSQIDEALRMSIYQVMTRFVNLCADCINIHREGRWKSFKRNAKRIVLDDGSVRSESELAHFKKLTQDQLNLQATLTLEVAVETGQDVKFMRTTTLDIDANTKAIKSDVSGLVEAENKRTLDNNRKQILSAADGGKWNGQIRSCLCDCPRDQVSKLADQDIVYARRVSGVCSEAGNNEKYFRDASCMDLWMTLGIGMPSKNTTHYILLDSVNTLSPADLERLLRAIQQRDQGMPSRVRVLTIDITKHNKPDIKAFIVEELKRKGIFQGADEDSQRRKTTVEERLWVRSNNSYLTIQQDLRKVEEIITSGGTEEELHRVLHESSTDPKELVRAEIEGLEAMLKAREIEEINELLVWVIASDKSMLLVELEAALFLRFKTVSLQPLDKKITGKYSKIFTLIYGKYLALKDHVRDCVVAQRDRPRQSADDPKITATISITNGDLKLVQRFFWDLNHYSFLGGFAFEPTSDQTNNLRYPFTTHLKALSEVTGLDELQPADKQFIGSHVYEMFNEGDVIERNWDFCYAVRWYERDDEMDIFWEWLDDPVAIAGLGPRDKRWLAELKKDKKHRNSGLLTPAMTMVARNWLQDTKWSTFRVFRWIRGFLRLGAEPQQEDRTTVAEQTGKSDTGSGRIIIYDNDSNVRKILKAEQWCKQLLGVTELDYTWCIRLGDTYADVREYDAASEQYKKAAEILQAQDPIDKEQLRDVFKTLAEFATDPDYALEYLKEAARLDAEDVEIPCAMLRQCTQSTLLMAMLSTALGKGNEIDMLAVFNAVFSVVSSSAELRAIFQHEMEVAIVAARTEGKNEELATLLFQLASDLRECLDTIRERVAEEDRYRLDFIKQSAIDRLSMVYFDRAIQTEGEEPEADVERLRQVHMNDPAAKIPKSALASLYSIKGQRDKARDISRAEIVEAFNILADDDILNDLDGFVALRNLLNHTGDYENALRAALLLPELRFDGTVLTTLLAGEGPSMEAVSEELVQYYDRECPDTDRHWESLTKLWREASRLADEADAASERAACLDRVQKLLAKLEREIECSLPCNTCNRYWDYDNGLHACKYCYNVFLCNGCWDELRSGKAGKDLVCSSTHAWYPLPPWTMEKYLQTCQGLVRMKTDNGGEELVSVSEWLGTLCEEWGLSKADWDFE